MDLFGGLRSVVKLKPVVVDNEVFQLHYRVTATLLLACSALVASKQHFGDPIDCITRDDVPNKIMDTYCWVHSTFTLPNSCNKTVGIEVAHPCVDKYDQNAEQESRIYHKYYQWVYFVLFFQAMCFYAPHLFWKASESRLMVKLAENFRNPISSDGKALTAVSDVSGYISRHLELKKSTHQHYFHIFTLCELANFVNVIVQIYLVDEFLGGTFTTYGLDVINYVQMDQDERFDPMMRIFPRMTKCTFHRFGSSGDVQRHDALCILPLNIINEKIYIVMWFWFVFLGVVTGAWLIYRLMTYTQAEIRYKVIIRRATMCKPEELQFVLKKCRTGDWFLLSMLCKNIDSKWFAQLIAEVYVEEKEKRRGGRKARKARPPARDSETAQLTIEEPSSREDTQDPATEKNDSDRPFETV